MALADDLTVTTTSGAVRGARQTTESVAFLGIPFAEPPTGERRFLAPQRRAPWEGVRPADAYGATPQREPFGPFVTVPEPSIAGDDTLGLNVFTPAPGDLQAALPVFVWIHGGGYFAGSPASPWYDGRSFCRDGVVTVSLSYRLGFQGFGWVDGTPLNRGLLDQIAGLEWVRDNIRAFGGDPSKVTIGGQSAGGGSVLALLASGRTDLFRGVVSQSGIAADLIAADVEAASRSYADSLGIEPTLEAWSAVPEARITATERAFNRVGQGPQDPASSVLVHTALEAVRQGVPSPGGFAWAPTIDGSLLTGANDVLHSTPGATAVPLLLGSTRNESSEPSGRVAVADVTAALRAAGITGAAERDLLDEVDRVGADRLESQLTTSSVFRTLVPHLARLRSTASGGTARTWTYDFAFRRSPDAPTGHCSDLPFTFDLLGAEGVREVLGDEPPQQLADAMHGDWVRFVTRGDLPWEEAAGSSVPTRRYENDGPVDQPSGYAFEATLAAA